MTEEEAQGKQCCGPEGAGYFNERPYPARWCVGSGCMAWRTRDVMREIFLPKGEAPPSPHWQEHGVMGQADGDPLTIWRLHYTGGFCGLAGERGL